VYGIWSLMTATTRPERIRHPSMAAGRMLTSMPRLSWPSRGGAQWMMTTSAGMRRWSSTGTSESRLGTYDRFEWRRMPAPTKHVSAVTPSRSGMPGGAFSA
jgi:hypothetical protein